MYIWRESVIYQKTDTGVNLGILSEVIMGNAKDWRPGFTRYHFVIWDWRDKMELIFQVVWTQHESLVELVFFFWTAKFQHL